MGQLVNHSAMIVRMECFASGLGGLLDGVSEEDAAWKPGDGAWSILEVVAHLGDEEALDFRERLEKTLRDPDESWEAIDPEGWAKDRRYNDRDLGDELARFTSERRRSLAWLRQVARPDWERAHEHERFGPISAGELMTSWCAHDALHLRQIAKRLFELAERDGGGFGSRYAGEWGA